MNAAAAKSGPLQGRLLWVSWTIWLVEVLVGGALLLLLVLLIGTIGSAARADDLPWWAAGPLLVILVPLALGCVWWMIRRWSEPLSVTRIQQALTGLAVVASFMALAYGTDGLEDDDSMFYILLAGIPVVWAIYRLCFLGLLRFCGIPDERSLQQRMRPVRFLVGFTGWVAAVVLMDEWRTWRDEGLLAEGHELWLLPALLGILLIYKIITQITEWRIRRKLDAAQPAEAAVNGN